MGYPGAPAPPPGAGSQQPSYYHHQQQAASHPTPQATPPSASGPPGHATTSGSDPVSAVPDAQRVSLDKKIITLVLIGFLHCSYDLCRFTGNAHADAAIDERANQCVATHRTTGYSTTGEFFLSLFQLYDALLGVPCVPWHEIPCHVTSLFLLPGVQTLMLMYSFFFQRNQFMALGSSISS